MSCFSCGQTFNGNVKELLQKYKQEKRDVYFYRECKNCDIKIVNRKQFKIVFERDIKPNFDKGAEYAHISEY